MAAACARCCMRMGSCFDREGDSVQWRNEKRLAMPVYISFALLNLVSTITRLGDNNLGFYGVSAAFLNVTVAAIVQATINPNPRHVLGVVCFNALFCTLCVDFNNAAIMQGRIWSLTVLIIDALLVFDLHIDLQRLIVAITILYLTVERSEAWLRFGLYDGAYLGEAREISSCNCADPPCSIPFLTACVGVGAMASVFVLDYFFTRGFASQLRAQMAIVDASVAIAERVAGLLADYSVEEAKLVVDGEDGRLLPPEMANSFQRLLTNLESYRVYLPDSVLFSGGGAGDCDDDCSDLLEMSTRDVPPPGMDGQQDVCICFTDIQSSTALWEACPQGMHEALQLHNQVLRKVGCVHSGYEVKTIGDSFMYAFPSALDGCRFALEAQLQLARQTWPAALRHELTDRVEGPLQCPIWNGLRVRIGLHWGPARAERNPVTSRCDYFGPTVNVAARVEAALRKGGLTGVTAAVLSAIGGHSGLGALGSPYMQQLGLRELKGVSERMELFLLLPADLAERSKVLTEEQTRKPPESPHRPGQARVGEILVPVRSAARGSHVARDMLPRASGFSLGALSSGSDESGRGARQAHARLGLAMRQTKASCAAVRVPQQCVSPQESTLSDVILIVEKAADMSHGVVASVLSAVIVVTWNAPHACADHSSAAMLFVGAVARNPLVASEVHYGLASGAVLSGNIASARRRFATVEGSCMELAAALAEEAVLQDDAGLVAGALADRFAAAGMAHRAQLWRGVVRQYGGDTQSTTAIVWELALHSADVGDWDFLSLDTSDASGAAWAAPLDSVFRRAAVVGGSEAQEMLREYCTSTPGDAEAKRLLERALRGALRTRDVPVAL